MTYPYPYPNQSTIDSRHEIMQYNLDVCGIQLQTMLDTQMPLPCSHKHIDKIRIDQKHPEFSIIFCYDCQCYCDGNGIQMPHFIPEIRTWK